MRSAAYVGRVGGLAVALGIGAAIATGQGVASADSTENPGSPESPSSPSTGQAADGPAASGPAAAAPNSSIEHTGLLVPPALRSERQDIRESLADRVQSRRKLSMATQADTESAERTKGPDNAAAPSEATTSHRTADDSATKPKGRSEPGDEAFGSPTTTLRSSLPSRQPEGKAFEHQPTHPGLASVTPTVRRAVDEDIDAPAPSDSVTSTQAQLSASSKLVSTTVVDRQPVITSAAVAAVKEPGIISRLLAPFGIGAQAANTDTPIAPVSATTLMGALELMRRELDRIFVNETPSFTYDSSTNVAANGAITGKVIPVDSDSTAFTYTATPPAEGDVVIDSNGNFTFTPNANYDPNTGTSFAVTVSDAGSGLHLHGLSSVLNLVTFGLMGESGHTHTQIVTLGGVVPAPDFHRTVVVSGLNQPTDFRFLPAINPNDSDEPDRVLIAEKGGAIKAYNGGQMQDQPVLTIPVATGWARGINGIEVDPGFNENGYIYASYIGADNIQRLSRFTVTDPTASVLIADPNTEKVLLVGDEPAGDDHHGGEIRYIDGKLYWATGDNVCCSVVDGSNSQDLSNIYGKVLRINPDGTAPTDNPYYNVPGARKEIYATGLRNPFRGGVTPDGQLLLGDVGQNAWEEIDLVSAGANFGWPYAEGVCPGPGKCNAGSDGKTTPIYAYQHGAGGGSSITSVLVYDGGKFGNQYDNAVFFADHNQQWVKAMRCDAGYTSCGTPITVVSDGGGTTRLAQGPDGSIYQMTLDGTLWRIAPSDTETLTV